MLEKSREADRCPINDHAPLTAAICCFSLVMHFNGGMVPPRMSTLLRSQGRTRIPNHGDQLEPLARQQLSKLPGKAYSLFWVIPIPHSHPSGRNGRVSLVTHSREADSSPNTKRASCIVYHDGYQNHREASSPSPCNPTPVYSITNSIPHRHYRHSLRTSPWQQFTSQRSDPAAKSYSIRDDDDRHQYVSRGDSTRAIGSLCGPLRCFMWIAHLAEQVHYPW